MSSYVDLMMDPQFDQPPWRGVPPTRYVILATPRVGSNLLCDLLFQAGLGVPLEYLSQPARVRGERLRRLEPGTPWLEVLWRRRTSPSGVFGTKVMPHQHTLPLRETRLLRSTLVIHVTRRDAEAQARSWATLQRTARPIRLEGEPEIDVPVSETGVHIADLQLERWRRDARTLVRLLGTPTMHVQYEDLVAQPRVVVSVLAERMGVHVDPDLPLVPRLRPSRDPRE